VTARRAYTHGPHLFKRGRVWYSRVPGLKPAECSLRTTERAEAESAHAARVAATMRATDAGEREREP
jgi:hypothetical protein